MSNFLPSPIIKLIENMLDEPMNIHSGHFMTSNPHTDELAPGEDLGLGVIVDEKDLDGSPQKGNAELSISEDEIKPVTFYKFGQKMTKSIAIDVSLRQLNKCIKVAYNKMITPKWKDFKGFRLRWKQRIRLNNVIWRAYYLQIQCKEENRIRRLKKATTEEDGKKTDSVYNFFVIPLEGNVSKDFRSVICSVDWKIRSYTSVFNLKRWRNYKERRRQLRGNFAQMDQIARRMLSVKFTDTLGQQSDISSSNGSIEQTCEFYGSKEIMPYMHPFTILNQSTDIS